MLLVLGLLGKYFWIFAIIYRNIPIEPEIFPAGTDSRYLRERGIPALGVSYIKNTPILLHDHDEYINENLFLEGIEFYTDLITHLANIQII